MSKHTPGPWLQSHRQTGPEAWNTQVYDEAGRTIATLAWYPVTLTGGLIGTAREANARLIAAAPDLLEACRYIVEAGETGDEETAIAKARAALAKAESEPVK